jgi:hypothetical protein
MGISEMSCTMHDEEWGYSNRVMGKKGLHGRRENCRGFQRIPLKSLAEY